MALALAYWVSVLSGGALLLLAVAFARVPPRSGSARWWSFSSALAGAGFLAIGVDDALRVGLVQGSLVLQAVGFAFWNRENGGRAPAVLLLIGLGIGAGFAIAVSSGWVGSDPAVGALSWAWTAVPPIAAAYFTFRGLGASSSPVRAQALAFLPVFAFGLLPFVLSWMILPAFPGLGWSVGAPPFAVLGSGLLLRALRRSDPRLSSGSAAPFVVEKTQDAVLFLRADGAVHGTNPAVKPLLDWDEDSLRGRMLSTLAANEESRYLLVSLEQLTFPDWEGTLVVANRTGRPVPVHVVFRRLHNLAREAVGAVLLLYDLRLPRRLDLSSREDLLTSLSNRRWVLELLEAEFQRVKRYGGPLSALWLDVADLSAIEVRFGTEASDDVLRRLGSILRGGLRRTDFCGRVGHREFLAVLPETPTDRAQRVAGRLEKMFALSEEGEPTGATLRIGWATLGEESPTSEAFLNELRARLPAG